MGKRRIQTGLISGEGIQTKLIQAAHNRAFQRYTVGSPFLKAQIVSDNLIGRADCEGTLSIRTVESESTGGAVYLDLSCTELFIDVLLHSVSYSIESLLICSRIRCGVSAFNALLLRFRKDTDFFACSAKGNRKLPILQILHKSAFLYRVLRKLMLCSGTGIEIIQRQTVRRASCAGRRTSRSTCLISQGI